VEGEPDLPKIVEAGRARGRSANTLHGREGETYDEPDDRDDHQQLKNRESATAPDTHDSP
jgi:hypothetical protein